MNVASGALLPPPAPPIGPPHCAPPIELPAHVVLPLTCTDRGLTRSRGSLRKGNGQSALMRNVKSPLWVPAPSTTMTASWPWASVTVTRDCLSVEGSMSSLQLSSTP
jgi:hypothetical protein